MIPTIGAAARGRRWWGEMTRTLGTASVLLTLLRHADRIKIGCATGGLGDLCMTSREHVWRGASYYPFAQLMRYTKGSSLLPVVTCDTYDVEGYAIDDMNQYYGFEGANYIQSAAAINQEENEMAVFVLNADSEDAQEFTLDVRGFEGGGSRAIQRFTRRMRKRATITSTLTYWFPGKCPARPATTACALRCSPSSPGICSAL